MSAEKGDVMSVYQKSDSKVGTIFGLIFFPSVVVFAYRLNKYFASGEAMTGGRYFWRNFGWSFLTSIPLVGLIYGLVKLDDIVNVRNAIVSAKSTILEVDIVE